MSRFAKSSGSGGSKQAVRQRGWKRAVAVNVLPVVAVAVATALIGTELVASAPTAHDSARSLNAAWSPQHYEGSLSSALDALTDPVRNAVGVVRSPSRSWQQSGVDTPPAGAAQASMDRGAGFIENALRSGSTTASGQGLVPWETFEYIPVTTDTTVIVDQGNGNLILKSTDGELATVGQDLSNDRYFNSVATYAGSQGGQWSTPLSGFDTGLSVSGTNRAYVAPSGNIETFKPDGSGGWTPPPSYSATLTTTTNGATLKVIDTGETITFNSSGWVLTDVDRNGVGNTYSYDASGQVTRVTEASGRFYSLAWSSTSPSYITSITDSANRTTAYGHDASGRLTRVDSPGGYWETYAYNAAGLVSQIQAVGPDANTTVLIDLTYDSADRVLSISQGTVGASAYARTTTYSGWGASGTVSETDGNGHVILRGISASNVPISTTDPLGRRSSWTHNANGDVVTYTAPGATTSSKLGYNGNFALTSTSTPTGSSSSASYATTSTCTGSGGSVLDPHCTSDPSGNSTAYQYDAAGNLVSTKDTTPSGTGLSSTKSVYAIGADGCYSVMENGVTSTRGLAGQVCSETDPNGGVTTYEYDTAGNQTAVNPPAPLGRTTATYDSLGRMTASTDGNGATTTYSYNVRDDVVSTGYASGSTMTTSWTPNGLKAGTIVDANNKDTFAYDALSELTAETTRHAGASRNLTYSYDRVGNLTGYSDPYGAVTYVYDAANQLTQLIEPGGSCTSDPPAATSGCIKFGYDVLGNETSRVFPGGASVATTRDSAGRAIRIVATTAAGTTVFDKAYSYAKNGVDTLNVQTATSNVETGVPTGAVTTYGYDSLDRLISAVETSGSTTTASWTYTYDADGNRTKQILAGAVGTAVGAPAAGTTTYSYNLADQLTATSADTGAWAYDADGQQTSDGMTGTASGFNDRKGVSTFGSASYTTYLEGNDPTYSRVDGATSTLYTNSSKLGLMGEDYGNQRIYDRTPDGDAVGSRLGGGSRYYFVQDSLDSIVGLFDKSGGYYGGYAYGPYGEPRFTSTDAALLNNHLRYVSGYFDTSINMYRLGARYYNPAIGRFTQQDPTPGGNENAYNYPDNPINHSDASGESSRNAYWSWNPWAAAAAWSSAVTSVAAGASRLSWDVTTGMTAALLKGVIYFAHKKKVPSKNANRIGHRGGNNSDKHTGAQSHGGGQRIPPNPNKPRRPNKGK